MKTPKLRCFHFASTIMRIIWKWFFCVCGKVFENFKFEQSILYKKKLFQFNYEHYGHYLQTVHDNLEEKKNYTVCRVAISEGKVFYSGHVFFCYGNFWQKTQKKV